MADAHLIARLANMREFAELATAYDEKRAQAIAKLGRQVFANPETHDRLEAERLRAFYRGVEDVFATVARAAKEERDRQEGESR